MLKQSLLLVPLLLVACAEQPQQPRMTAYQMYQMQCANAGIGQNSPYFEDCMMRMAQVDQQRRAALGNAMLLNMMGR